MKRIFVFVFIAALFAACGSECGADCAKDCCKKEETSSTENSSTKVEGGTSFGEAITLENAIAYDELLTKMEGVDSMAVKVKGKVSGVCQKKGCWMTLVPENGDQEMMVRFKDYGFFMPMDIAGRTVVLDGYAFRETVTVEELKHYAEDAGQSAEEIAKITEPEEELSYMAHGVVLLD